MKESQYKSLRIVRRYFPKVEMVVDANRPCDVEVTQHDVDHSVIQDHTECALAVATCRVMKADGVIIGLTTSYVVRGKKAYRYHNTETISREITSFDRKAGFDVGSYRLSPFSESCALGKSHNPQHHGPSGKSGKAHPYRHYTKNVRATLR